MPNIPQNPAQGDLVVGNGLFKQWAKMPVGTDDFVLKANSLNADHGMEWTNDLGVKTFQSDFTLHDTNNTPSNNLVLRVSPSAETSFVSSHASQLMRFGGHTAGASLTMTMASGLHEITASNSRDLQFQVGAARDFIIQHNSTDSFRARAGDVRSLREFRAYDSTAVGYARLTADASGNAYLTSTHPQKQMYLCGVPGSTADGLRVRSTGGDTWIESTSNFLDIINNVRSGGTYTWMYNYGTKMRLTTTDFSTNVRATLSVTDAATTSASYGLQIDHGSTATPAAGFGSSLNWRQHDSTNTLRTAGEWAVIWEDATALDAAIRFRCVNGGAYLTNNLLYLSGSQQIGILTDVPSRTLDVRGDGYFSSHLEIDGDLNHDGTNVGFYAVAPVARPAAYTQTYATATRTHANLTAATLTDNTGETPDATIEDISVRSSKFWAFASPAGSSGTFYFGGFYKWHSVSFTPIVGGTNVGTANSSYAAHAVVIDGAAGLGQTISVLGTSITDAGVRTTSDTENIVTDGTANKYYETSKKWIGQVQYKFVSGDAQVINAGFAKYWDFGNTDFTVVGCEATWLGGANDTAADIRVLHHTDTGWTYGAGGTPTLPTALAAMATDHSTEGDVKNNENGAWKRTNLSQLVLGSASEGIMFEVVTGANKAFEQGTLQVDVEGGEGVNRNFADLTSQVNKLIADLANTKQVLNQSIDDHQANGLLQ